MTDQTSRAPSATISALARPHDVRGLSLTALHLVMAMRLCALFERADRDPVPDLARRYRSVEAACAVHGLVRNCTTGHATNIIEGFAVFFTRQFAVGEKTFGRSDTAQLYRLALERLVTVTDDAFCRATANVHYQPQLAVFGWLRMSHTQIDQARFFAAGNHFDRVA